MIISGIQCSFSDVENENIDKLSVYIQEASKLGARVVLAPELFQGHYFCQHIKNSNFDRARSVEQSSSIKEFKKLSKEHQLFLPVSFFEKDGQDFYNSMAIIDKGEIIDLYRKSHIPEGVGYEEREYFKEGNTGFKVWDVDGVKVGAGICWDQWFPELARCLRLLGAEIILYPTAIGSEPNDLTVDTSAMWQTVMQGHAVANSVAVLAANRIGQEDEITFYGSSFISNHKGEKVLELDRVNESLFYVEYDFEQLKKFQANWPFLKHRRPELYSALVKERSAPHKITKD